MTLRCLVIGYGSIGARHAAILAQLGHPVHVVSRRGADIPFPNYRTVEEAFGAVAFDYIVLAVETAGHRALLEDLAARGFAGTVLVEKPLYDTPAPLPRHRFASAGVGYNYRFLPAIQALKAALGQRRAEIADLYVGQWLPDWRPGRLVADTYSASRAGGGGVLRDLSHELDMVTWLFGPWQRVTALGGRLSDLTIDTDDAWGILISCARCPVVSLQMNAFDRDPRRRITVQTGGETLRADLIANRFGRNHDNETLAGGRDISFAAMHKTLLAGSPGVATLEEGLATLDLIAAIESSVHEGRWIERDAG